MSCFRIATAAAVLLGSATVAVAATPPPLLAPRAAVASDHPAASAAGLAVLKAGGNAVDAACATALALGVVHPESSGIGGGGFAIVHIAKQNKTYALDFRERAPAAITPASYLKDGKVDAGAVEARRPGRRRPRRGARAGRDGQALGRAAVRPLCRSGAEAGGARLPGLVAAGARSRGPGDEAQGRSRRREVPGGVRRQEAGGRRHLASARSGAHARQAARAGRTRSTRGDRGRDRQGGARRGRRDDGRGPRGLHRDRADAAGGRLPRAACGVDAAAVVGRHRAGRDAGHPGGALPRRADARRARRGRAICTCWPRRSSTASPTARATWAIRTSSPSTSRTWRSSAYHAELARRIKPGAVLPRDAYGTLGPPPAPRKDARDRAPVGDRRRRQRGGADHDRQPRLWRRAGRGQDRHPAQRPDGRLLAGAGRAQRVRPDRQRAERDRAAQAAAVVDDADDRAGRGRQGARRRRRGRRPDDHHGRGAGADQRRRLQAGRAGRGGGAAHPSSMVPGDARGRAGCRAGRDRLAQEVGTQGERASAHRNCERAGAHGRGHRGRRRAAQPERRRRGTEGDAGAADNEGPDRQPRRDRVPRDPRLPRAGSAHGRGALGRRHGGAARAPGRRGGRHRSAAGARQLPARREDRGRDTAHGRRRRPSRLRLPVRERRVRGGGGGGGRDVHRAAAVGDPRHGRQDRGARADAGGRRAGRARRQRAGRARLRRPRRRRRWRRRASATR